MSAPFFRFLDAPLAARLDAHTIRVWVVPLTAAQLPASLDRVLSAQEQLHAARFHFTKDATRFKLCRALLRLGIAAQLHLDPADIAFATGPQGKPLLADPKGEPLPADSKAKPLLAGASSLHFNVSHCEDLALIAFAVGGEIGIDVENYRSDLEAVELAHAHFTPAEAVMVSSASGEPQQVQRFLRLWTRKEAVLKAAGCGLLQDLNTFDVSGDAIQLVDLPPAANRPPRRWQVRDLGPTGPVVTNNIAPMSSDLATSTPGTNSHAATSSNLNTSSTIGTNSNAAISTHFAALAGPEGNWKIEQFTLSPATLFEK